MTNVNTVNESSKWASTAPLNLTGLFVNVIKIWRVREKKTTTKVTCKFSYLLLELPQKKQLLFPCGVKVEVSFSALFSNVLVAFATIKTTGNHTQDCTVTLSSTPVSIYLIFYLFN